MLVVFVLIVIIVGVLLVIEYSLVNWSNHHTPLCYKFSFGNGLVDFFGFYKDFIKVFFNLVDSVAFFLHMITPTELAFRFFFFFFLAIVFSVTGFVTIIITCCLSSNVICLEHFQSVL